MVALPSTKAYEDGACRLHAIQSGMHRLRADAGTAVQNEEDLKSLLQRIQHRVKDAVVGGDPRHHQRGHPPRPQQLHQARRVRVAEVEEPTVRFNVGQGALANSVI